VRRHTRAATCAALALLLLGGLAACSGDDGGDGSADGSTSPAPSASEAAVTATVPDGWTTGRAAGLTLAYPPEWQVRTDAQGVALQVGVPFTGQPFPPPQLQVYVEETQVGTLQVREPLTKAQISQQLGGIEIPPSTPVEVAGARAAVQFTYAYRTAGGTSTMNTPLDPTDMRQTDVLIDVPGLPKYGLRYSAPADQYDEQTWQQILGSVSVAASGPGT
jgi:hypothetical protein